MTIYGVPELLGHSFDYLAHIAVSLSILDDVLPPELAFFVSVFVPGLLRRQQWVFAICVDRNTCCALQITEELLHCIHL